MNLGIKMVHLFYVTICDKFTYQLCDNALKKLRFVGHQVCGKLIKTECDEKGVMLHIEIANGVLKLRSSSFKQIRFVTYTSEVKGKIECGASASHGEVLITYRKLTDDPNTDGEAIAVEFVPPDWNHLY